MKHPDLRVLASIAVLLLAPACKKQKGAEPPDGQGPMEEAGEAVDQGAEEVQEGAEDVVDDDVEAGDEDVDVTPEPGEDDQS